MTQQEVLDRVREAVAGGSSKRDAFRALGISPNDYYFWAMGKAYRSKSSPPSKPALRARVVVHPSLAKALPVAARTPAAHGAKCFVIATTTDNLAAVLRSLS